MIKNILYSLFLHSLLALLIYVNFKSNLTDEILELKEGISVSIASFDTHKKSNIDEKIEAVKKDPKKKKEIQKIVKKKKSIAKKTISQPMVEKNNEFKKPEEDKKDEALQEEVKEENNEIKEEEIITKPDAASPSEKIINDLENLNLSAREKFNIHSQLKSCYHRALINDPDNKTSITIKVSVLPDGTIDFDSEKIIDIKRYNDPKEANYRKMMDDLIATIEFCSPLRNMPADKYDVWKEFTIEFGGI